VLQGVAIGAIATALIGFTYGGWVSGRTAQKMADQHASEAVVAVLAPICVEKFQRGAEATTTLAQLKATDSWQQDTFIVKGGWATFPGTGPNRNVAEACAKLLNK
jgi:alpha/beta superfamily hydrolase